MTTPVDARSPAAPIRATCVRWRLVFLLMGFTGLNHFHRQSLPAVVNDLMRDCRFTETDMSWIYSAFLFGYVVSMIPGGRLADRRGGWFTLVLSGFGTAAFVALSGYCNYGLSTSAAFIALLVVRYLMGVFTAPLFPAAGRIVAAWIPFGKRAWANGLVLGATTIGVSLAPVGFGELSDLVGWRAACAVMGSLTALLALVWFWYGRDTPDQHASVNEGELALLTDGVFQPEIAAPRASAQDFLELIKKPGLVFLTLNYAAVGYYEYTLFYWMKYYFADVRGYPEQTSRYFTGIVSAAMIVAMPLGGILSDWFVRIWGYRAGRMSVPIFGMLASAVLLFVATRAENQTAVVALFFLAHAAIGLCEAPTWVAGLEIGGKDCGTSAAFVNTGGNLGGMLAPVVTAYVSQAYGWETGFAVASLVCLFGAVQWFGVRLVAPGSNRG